ncbi:hypothetical protein LMG27174_05151 [Paraburkholderia rhynchosiae]|nr:hypothetical protein LMG27174_05151 [Paraburkholderia rhynchosiae]
MSDHKLGTVNTGLIEPADYNGANRYDVMLVAPASVLGSLVADQPRPFVDNNERDPGRLPGTIRYESKSIGGFNLQTSYSFGSANTANSSSYTVAGLNYDRGARSRCDVA